VRTVQDSERPAGVYSLTWDGCDQRGRMSPNGVYFCTMKAGEYSAGKKLVISRQQLRLRWRRGVTRAASVQRVREPGMGGRWPAPDYRTGRRASPCGGHGAGAGTLKTS
jgi:flagellar hook assembly protein FlgD